MKTTKFMMEIQLTIRRVDMEDGHQVGGGYNDRLSLNDSVDLGPKSLSEVLQLMGKLHTMLNEQTPLCTDPGAHEPGVLE